MPDINVDEEQLHKFIEVLSQFQDEIRDKMRVVSDAYARCLESWKGESASQFQKEFEETKQAVETAIQVGNEALDWLWRFDEIVREFEGH
jgi:uncharacterized protein YukE